MSCNMCYIIDIYNTLYGIFMENRQRNHGGRFLPKSDEIRQVRSIRLTDTAWEKLGKLAEIRGITRADLIEDWMINDSFNSLNQQASSIQQLEIDGLKHQIDLLQTMNSKMLPNLQKLRDYFLVYILKLGRQSAKYKSVKENIDSFISQLLRQK